MGSGRGGLRAFFVGSCVRSSRRDPAGTRHGSPRAVGIRDKRIGAQQRVGASKKEGVGCRCALDDVDAQDIAVEWRRH
jgi:hypothetical protein